MQYKIIPSRIWVRWKYCRSSLPSSDLAWSSARKWTWRGSSEIDTSYWDSFCGWIPWNSCAWNYRPIIRENKPKTLVLYDWKRAFWAGFRENWVYKFGHWKDLPKYKNSTETVLYVTYLVLKLQLGEMIKWKHCKIMWHHRVLRQHRHTNSIRNIKNIRNIRNFEVTKFREHPYCTGPWELGLGPYGFLVPVCDRRL